MKIYETQHGVEIMEGLPGSGKTFFAVRRALRVIQEQKRPVYTNLPMKFRVVKQRLRNLGGEELANLIRPLTEGHWRRYLRRHEAYADLLEKHAKIKPADAEPEIIAELSEVTGKPAERIRQQQSFHSNQMRALFVKRNGPDIYEGPDANEIPAFSVICIDEVQNWHSMIDQSKDPDRQRLLQYISKHRHSLHWVWVITQDTRNISIEFRRQAQSIWSIMSLGDVKLAWGLKFKHLRINATIYKRYTHDQYEMKERNGDVRAETFILYTKLPWLRKIYRYYEPYTNSGTKRQLQKQLARSRRKAGLSESGLTKSEEMRLKKKVTILSKVTRYLMIRAAILAAVILAFVVGYTSKPKENGETVDAVDVQAAQANQETKRSVEWPEWTIAGQQPWIGGKRLSVGDTLANGARLDYIGGGGASLVLVRDGTVWLWEYGKPSPRAVGALGEVRRAFEAARADGRLLGGGFPESSTLDP